MTQLRTCPECDTQETERQMVEWMHDGVDVIFSCPDCMLDFVVSLRRPVKEVTHRYE